MHEGVPETANIASWHSQRLAHADVRLGWKMVGHVGSMLVMRSTCSWSHPRHSGPPARAPPVSCHDEAGLKQQAFVCLFGKTVRHGSILCIPRSQSIDMARTGIESYIDHYAAGSISVLVLSSTFRYVWIRTSTGSHSLCLRVIPRTVTKRFINSSRLL